MSAPATPQRDRTARLLLLICVLCIAVPARAEEAADSRPPQPAENVKPAPLPPHALARLDLGERPSPLLGVYGLTYSPDGNRLATRSADQIVRVWDTSNGRLIATIDGHKDRVLGMAFSPDGRLLATCSLGDDPAIRCWDPATGKLLREIAGGARQVSFLPDSQTLRALDESALITCPAAGDKQRLGLQGLGTGLAISHGETAALFDSSNRRINLFRPSDGTTVRLHGHPSTPIAAAFSSDGVCFAAATDRSQDVHVWNLREGGKYLPLRGHTAPVQAVVFSPDARHLASGSWDQTIRIWELATQQCVAVVNGHQDHVCAVDFSHDGRRLASGAAGGADSSVLIWDIPALLFIARQKLEQLSPADQQILLTQLSADDARVAYAAIGSLIAAPETAVPLLAGHIEGGPQRGDDEIRQWIKQLDDDDFKVREAAHQRLLALRTEADAVLRESLKNAPSPEVRHRIEQILKKPLGAVTKQTEEQRRWMRRAVLALEQIGNEAAQKQLATLAAGPADQQHVQEANAALKRLQKSAAGR